MVFLISILLFILTFASLYFPMPIPATFADPRFYLGLFFITGSIFKNKINFQKIENLLSQDRYKWILIFILITHALALKYWQWQAGLPSGSDFGHYDYAVWNAFKGNDLVVSIMKPQYYSTLMGNHFAPILYLFAPLHFILESHYWLMAMQALAVGLTFYFALELSKMVFLSRSYKNITSYLLALALVFNFSFLQIIKYEFHPEVFFIPFFLLFVFAWYKQNWLILVLSMLLALSVKEDASLYMISLVLLFIINSLRENNKKKLAISLLLLIILPITFGISMYVIKKYIVIENQSSFLSMWSKYGATYSEVMMNMFKNPHWVIKDIFSKVQLYKILLPWLFLPLMGWQLVTLITPSVINLTSEGIISSLTIYYSAPFIAALFWSFLIGIDKFKKKFSYIVGVVFLFNMFVGLGTYSIPQPNININEQVIRFNEIRILAQNEEIWLTDQLIAQVPYGLNIRRLSEYGGQKGWIFISKKVFGHPLTREQQIEMNNSLKLNSEFEIISDDDRWTILRKI